MSFDRSATGPLENQAPPLWDEIADARSGGESTSTSDCESLASSQTSTDLYGHEPFETFVHKVHRLLTTIFPGDLPIQVERMPGGSYNRVVRGVLGYDQQSSRRVVVRIPRFTYRSPVDEIAILRFLRSTTAVPVPAVLHFYMSSAKIISDPYIILEYLTGTCLSDVYDDLPAHVKEIRRSKSGLLAEAVE